MVVGTATTLALALGGAGIWALILGNLVAQASRAVLFTSLATERLRFAWSRDLARGQFRFGGLMAVQAFFVWLSSQVEILVLGRTIPAAQLGNYHVARMLAMIPNQKLGWLLGQIPMSAFARLQGRPDDFRDAFKSAIEMLLRFTVPGFVLLSILGPQLVPLVLGEQWAVMVPILTPLALAMPAYMVLVLGRQALNALGRAEVGAVIYVGLTLALGLTVFLAAPYGLPTVARSVALTHVGVTLVAFAWIGGITGFGLRALLDALWRPAIASAVMYGVVAVAREPWADGFSDPTVLALSAGLAGATYVAMMLVLDRRGLVETWRYLRA
jgi:PST family polysaccharide transporter